MEGVLNRCGATDATKDFSTIGDEGPGATPSRRWLDRVRMSVRELFGSDRNRADQDATKLNPAPGGQRTNLFAEVSNTLKWVQDRAAALGAIAFGLANWLWFDFVSHYHIPIGIFSPAVLSALPSMLASVVVIVLVMTAGALTPSMVLGTALNSNGPALIDFRGRTSSEGHKQFDAWNQWLLVTIFSAALWAIVFVGGSVLGVDFADISVEISVWAVFLLAVVGGYQRLTLGVSQRKSWDFRLTAIFGLAMQNFLLLLTLIAALSYVHNVTFEQMAGPGAAYLGVALAIAVGQCAGTSFSRKHGFRRGILVRSLVLSGVSLWVIAIFPAAGGALASLPIRVTSSGDRSCVVLSVRNDATKPIDSHLMVKEVSAEGISKTKALRMALLLDGTYYLKANLDDAGEVLLLPKEVVTAVDSCPKLSDKATAGRQAAHQAQPRRGQQ